MASEMIEGIVAPGSSSSSWNESSWEETPDDGRTDRTCFGTCVVVADMKGKRRLFNRGLLSTRINPLTPTVAKWVQLQSILYQTGLTQSFVIFDIRALW